MGSGIGVLMASNIPETLGVPALQTFREADQLYKTSGWCGFRKSTGLGSNRMERGRVNEGLDHDDE